MGRVRASIVAVEKQWVAHDLCVCICSHRYPAYNAHASYCHLWPAPLYNIFPHFLINGTIFEKEKVTEHKICVLIFSIMFVCNISNSKKKWERYDLKMYIGLHEKYPLFSSDFNETWIFSKNPQITNFMKIRPVGAELFHADRQTGRQTDRLDKAINRISHSGKRA